MREVVLDELIVRFDGSVVEVFIVGRGSTRFHIRHLERAELLRLDSRKGPTLNIVGHQHGGVSFNNLAVAQGVLPELQVLVAEINVAIV